MSIRPTFSLASFLVAVLFLGSCGIIESKPGDMAVARTKDDLMYFLPTGRVSLHVTIYDRGTAKIVPTTIYLPDTSRAYYVRYTESWMSNDQVSVKLQKNGLLSEVSTASEDATPQIISTLGQTAAKILQFLAVPVGGPAPPPEKPVFDAEVSFDPTTDSGLQRANALLNHVGMSVECESEGRPNPNSGIYATATVEGIYYRPLMPYTLTVNSTGGGFAGVAPYVTSFPRPGVQSTTIYLPNDAPILTLDLQRKAFVKNTVKLEFDDGVLESVGYNKPSEALGLVQIPADLAKTILSTASNAFVFRYQDMNTDQQLVGVQKQLGDTQKQLIQTQQSLIQSQQGAIESTQLSKQKKDAAGASPDPENPAPAAAAAAPGATTNVYCANRSAPPVAAKPAGGCAPGKDGKKPPGCP